MPGQLRRAALTALVAAALALLAACGSSPPKPATNAGTITANVKVQRPAPMPAKPDRDGPEANPPPDLHLVPDAEPQLETVRSGGANKAYEVLGQAYVPLAGDPPLVQRGLASWYGAKFHGRSTANGETYNMYAMTAAHRTMPLPSYARVRNPANGREVVVRVNDRGPFHSERVIDLSYTAALKLGVLGGVAKVEIERITYEAIRTGAWRVPMPVSAKALANNDTPGIARGWPGAEMRATPVPQQPTRQPVDEAMVAIAANAVAAAAPTHAAAAGNARAADDLPTATAGIPAKPPAEAAPEPLPQETTAPARAAAKAAPGFWLQLGAFAQADGAIKFQQRVAADAPWLAPLMAIFNERSLHRLQAGPYASRADARGAAEHLREALRLVPAIVERR